MKAENNYETISEAVDDLIRRGYTIDFSLIANQNCLIFNKPLTSLSPDEFKIDEIHHFEKMNSSIDEMIVFAISSLKYHIKGTVINGFGIYSNSTSLRIIQQLELSFKYNAQYINFI